MPQQIFLVRHGRSAHVQAGFLDLTELVRWREAYEAAGIDEGDPPPPALKALASTSGVIVASTAPRAVQSAKLLDSGRDVIPSPLLEELELLPLDIRRVRMPLIAWALTVGIRMIVRKVFRGPRASIEIQRAREAADWLSGLAERHAVVLAVTHASFRSLLAAQLVERGWLCEVPKRRSHHWSVWPLRR
jgi:broad specificity phosphatase PhoE